MQYGFVSCTRRARQNFCFSPSNSEKYECGKERFTLLTLDMYDKVNRLELGNVSCDMEQNIGC